MEMSMFFLNSKEHLRDQTGNLNYFWQYQRCNLLAPDTSVWIICRLQRSAKQLLDRQPDLPNNIQERGSKFYRDEVLLFFEHWDKMKRKRQLLRAKLSNMLLSLDTTIGFYLYFKAAKFEKMVWDVVETGNKGREIWQGKAESIHGPGLVVGTSAGTSGGIVWAGSCWCRSAGEMAVRDKRFARHDQHMNLHSPNTSLWGSMRSFYAPLFSHSYSTIVVFF